MRSPSDANARCVAMRPQFSKQPERSHQPKQNSWPASLLGGRCCRTTGRVPPGRNVILLKSASGCGLATRATAGAPPVGSVRADTAVALAELPAPLVLEVVRVHPGNADRPRCSPHRRFEIFLRNRNPVA